VLDAVDQITTRTDPHDGRSKLIHEGSLELIKRALNRGG